MGFLGRKNTDYTELFASTASASDKAHWIKKSSQQNVLTQWEESISRVEELFTETVLYYPEKQPEFLKSLNKIKLEWIKTDRALVTSAEATVLYDVIHQEIPALVYRLGLLKSTRGSSNKNHEDDYLGLQKKMEKLLSAVLTVRAKVDAQKLSRFKDSHHGFPANLLFRLTWPVYADLPEDVTQKLAELGKLWISQREATHSTEDEYLLERIITDYIPSSIQLYAPFKSGTVEMESAARAALLNQLALIQNHLERVVQNNFQERMKTVHAQTEFLQERLNDN